MEQTITFTLSIAEVIGYALLFGMAAGIAIILLITNAKAVLKHIAEKY